MALVETAVASVGAQRALHINLFSMVPKIGLAPERVPGTTNPGGA